MFDVALHGQDGPVLLKDVARRQEISQKYLAHLVAPLKGAGLLHSSRGAHGGYVLSRPPQDITLAEVIRAVEGNLDFVECVGAPGICDRVDSCVTRDIWKRMSDKMMEMLSGIQTRRAAAYDDCVAPVAG